MFGTHVLKTESQIDLTLNVLIKLFVTVCSQHVCDEDYYLHDNCVFCPQNIKTAWYLQFIWRKTCFCRSDGQKKNGIDFEQNLNHLHVKATYFFRASGF